jgi:uncharacterized protein (DUF697 family)/GTP-binding protein EngB required for normal cell division
MTLAQITERWELAASDIEGTLRNSLVIAFVGAASAGKDAAIRALFGLDFGEVDPIPGSTDRLRAIALDPAGQTVVVNAPGFGDLRGQVESASRSLLDRLDACLFFVNADGGATADDKANLDAVRALGRPVLLCLNKIDLIRPHQREMFIHSTLTQLGVERSMAAVTAFDPMPALSPFPIGVDEVVTWLMDVLGERKKGLLFAKALRNKAAACEPIIRGAAARAALAGAVPIPGADIAAVTAVHVKLISDIAAVHGQRLDKDIALFILGEVLAGSAKGFVRWGAEALKAAGWLPGGQLGEVAASALGATVASAATYGVGRAAVAYMQNMEKGNQLSGDELRKIFDAEAFAWKDRK